MTIKRYISVMVVLVLGLFLANASVPEALLANAPRHAPCLRSVPGACEFVVRAGHVRCSDVRTVHRSGAGEKSTSGACGRYALAKRWARYWRFPL